MGVVIVSYDFLRFSVADCFAARPSATLDALFKRAVLQDTPWREPRWKIASLFLGGQPVGILDPRRHAVAAGASIDGGEAMARGVGEALERYSAFNFFQLEKPILCKVDSGKRYIRCASYEESPRTFKEISSLPAIEHALAIQLEDMREELLPYEALYLGFLKEDSTDLFSSPISTGCAFHTGLSGAIYSGILEGLERDALMHWWQTGFPNLRRIVAGSAVEFSVTERVRRVRDAGLRLYLFEISRWSAYPVVFCLVMGDAYPYVAAGVSCDGDIVRAMAKAIDEAVSIRAVTLSHRMSLSPEQFERFDWITTLEHHMHLYANWSRSPIIERLLGMPSEEVCVTDYPRRDGSELSWPSLQALAKEIRRCCGGTVYYKDITLPEVRPYGYVVKVYIPEFMPLSQTMRVRWLGGLEREGYTESMINPYPHPFS